MNCSSGVGVAVERWVRDSKASKLGDLLADETTLLRTRANAQRRNEIMLCVLKSPLARCRLARFTPRERTDCRPATSHLNLRLLHSNRTQPCFLKKALVE